MDKKPLFILFTLAAAGLQAQQPPAPAPSPSPEASPSAKFPAQIEQVTVDVVVTDKKGVPIAGLGRNDFTVSEDDQAQSIVSFEEVTVPPATGAAPPPRPRVSMNTTHEVRTGRSFVVVFDDIHLTPFQAQRAKGAVAEFLKKGAREGDRVTLVATGGGAWWTARMEAGRDEMLEMLKRLDGRFIPDMSPERVTDYEAMRIHVYHDTQVADRVKRRFDTYGVNPGGQSSGTGNQVDPSTSGSDDPLVSARAADVYFQAVSRNRITLQVLERALGALAPNKGRKSMVLVSEGFIYDPNLDEFKKVLEASRRSNVAVYFLDTRGLSGMPTYMTAQFGPALDSQDIGAAFAENLEEAEGAESIAADTGGFTVKNTNALGEGIQRIADESRSYYLIGYNPTNGRRDGRFRKIEVKVDRKSVKVRARKGYYAPLEGSQLAEKKPGVDPEFQAALDSPYDVDAIPMRMTDYVFDETLLGKATVRVATDVDLRNFAFQEADGRFADTLEFLMVVAHRETGEFFRYDQKVDMKLLPATRERLMKDWMPLVRDFELSPGGYQAKIVVRDKNGGRIGSVIHEFEVPQLGPLRVSTPVMSDVLQKTPTGEEGPPRPAMLARRNFASGSMLYVQFEVYGAAKDKTTGLPKVTAGYQIRRSDGEVERAVAPSTITPTSIGRVSRLVGTRLEGASPGEYELVLTVRDEVAGKSVEVREPFTVEVAPPTAS
jgi:VWFA-related protein